MSVTFTFTDFPKSKEELERIPEYSLDTPFKAAALTMLVLLNYQHDVNKTIELLNCLKGPQPLSNYDIQFLRDRLGGKTFVVSSYFEGATVANGYVPNKPYKITVHEDIYSYTDEGYARLTLQSSGADSKRPIKLRKKDTKWYLWENMLLADIRPPAGSEGW